MNLGLLISLKIILNVFFPLRTDENNLLPKWT